MPVAKINLEMIQGAEFRHVFRWSNKDCEPIILTGFEARMQVRQSKTTTGTPILDLTSANGDIEITPAEGKVLVIVPSSVTTTISKGGPYDLELVLPAAITGGDDFVMRLAQGRLSVNREVTK